jgi:hypothetical protein
LLYQLTWWPSCCINSPGGHLVVSTHLVAILLYGGHLVVSTHLVAILLYQLTWWPSCCINSPGGHLVVSTHLVATLILLSPSTRSLAFATLKPRLKTFH